MAKALGGRTGRLHKMPVKRLVVLPQWDDLCIPSSVCHTRSASSCSILDTRWLLDVSCGTTPRFREKIGLRNELKDSSPSVIGRQLVTIH